MYGNVNPLEVSREKLAKDGIRPSKKMHDVVFRTIGLASVEDVPDYLDDLYGERSKIVISEIAFDWLASNAAHQLSALCEAD